MLGGTAGLVLRRGGARARSLDRLLDRRSHRRGCKRPRLPNIMHAGDSQAAPQLLGLIDRDQWTVAGDFNSAASTVSLQHWATPRAPKLYVSSISGRAVQITTADERFWNWLGAVPHWLYFTELRRHAGNLEPGGDSILRCSAAFSPASASILAYARSPRSRRAAGRRTSDSIYGTTLPGLVFGVFTLTWVLSGLLSMNPWGWLEGVGAQAESTSDTG